MSEMYAHVTVRILEKEYHVACPANEKSALLASADLLNAKMREIRDAGKVVGLDRVAVMAALNLANELLETQGRGDELKDIDLHAMYEFHKRNRAVATIALTTVSDPCHYGVARLDGNRILEFVEKPAKGKEPSNLINSGLYIMEPEVIDMIKPGFCMTEKYVFPLLARQGKLFGFPFSGQWFDTGNMERYERAIKEWKDLA